MTEPTIAPYGSWRSPISLDVVTAGRVGVGAPRFAADGTPHWLEGRPQEGGRQVLVRRVGERNEDVTPAGFNVRSRVHEYGGGAYVLDDQGGVLFSNFADGRIYRQPSDPQPEPLTAAGPYRYGDLVLDPRRGRLLCIREDHSDGVPQGDGGDGQSAAPEPVNTLAAIALDDGTATVLVSGNDFYSTPRVSPDGTRLAWLTWNHPNMPWDGTELWLGAIAPNGSISGARRVAGGPDESIFQPEWSPAGELYFSSDRSGWWNLYRVAADAIRVAAAVPDAATAAAVPDTATPAPAATGQDGPSAEPVAPMEADIGRPQWGLGMLIYGFTPAGDLYAVARNAGADRILRLSRGTHPEQVETSATEISTLVVGADRLLLVGSSEMAMAVVSELELATGEERTLKRSSELELPREYVSRPRLIEFPTEGDLTAHALYYPPHNPDFRAPERERPPLVVSSHGGPTAGASWTLNPLIQIYTSRGIGYLDVDYGGSTGYGRAYWKRLEENWGIVDVDDCVNAARFLAQRGEVDAERIAITGGSAGGYTTLAALTFRDFFRAGVSYFGIGDLESFRAETHKFESRYDQRLVGRWPEHAQRYRDRSPANFPERISAPMLILQGLDDRIVPPSQAEQMVAALREKGIPHAYLAFEGEDHGFRKAENIRRSLEAELSFYAQVFGFELADEIQPLRIEGLKPA